MSARDSGDVGAALRPVLKSQYHAALAMLRETIERCPEDEWTSRSHVNAFWQVAYHTLFFAHLYLQPDEAAFVPWAGQRSGVQYPDGIPGPPDPKSPLPLLPEPYSREEVLAYWRVCDDMVDAAVDRMDLGASDCGFWWYKASKLEHQFVNVRHVQHHAAQLADRLRSAANIGISWVGAGGSKTQICAQKFARALDRYDFDAVAAMLAPGCRYDLTAASLTSEGTLVGADDIVASYRSHDARERRLFDRVEYSSVVEAIDGERAVIRFTDVIEKGGVTHQYSCRQQITVDEQGRIDTIVHEDIPAEVTAVRAFLEQVGVTL